MPDKLPAPLSLFPPIDPYQTGSLKVLGGHELYFECSGNPDGQPILFLHGGPGTGSSPDTRRLFNHQRCNIIQFDQRGCGKSTPHGSLIENTTDHLVDDIIKLLNLLSIDQVHLAGGSWGSTLALAFAMTHPNRVRSILIYGIFLCRASEFKALYFEGGVVSQIYPEVFSSFIELLPNADRADPIKGYAKLFGSNNIELRNNALHMWTLLEQQASRLIVDQKRLQTEMANPDYVLSHSLIENHYFQQNGFLDGDQLLTVAGERLADIPTHIINGRYDLICPMITAHELNKAIPHSKLTIVPDAGHSFRDPGMCDVIIRASSKLHG
ncbi:MAG: prolyl aminopeptidase [bacterium]|nr:prolyl aminopeptidase [bacterium]